MTATSALSATESDGHETANPFPDLPAICGPAASPQPARDGVLAAHRFTSPRFGDYSRTRFESRVFYRDQDEETEEVAAETRRFSLVEITSDLPDDSREADERAAERGLRDLRGRVKAARAAVEATPGLAETLTRDWQKAARFYAWFGISEIRYRRGVEFDSAPSITARATREAAAQNG